MKWWYIGAWFLFNSLFAEIEQVQITWNHTQCDQTCISLLRRTLDKFPPVAAYKMEGEKGTAYLRWNPESQFDLLSVKRIYQTVGFGFGIGDVIVKVRGVIERKGKDFVIKSLGDNTKFRILGSANPSKTSFSSTGSYLSYPLNAEQRKQLEEGYSQKLVTEITGGIYYTEYDYPMIMINKLSFPNKL